MSENKSLFYFSSIVFLCAIFSYFYIDKYLAVYFHNLNSFWITTIFHYITKIGDSHYSLVMFFLFFLFFRQNRPFFAQKMLYLFSVVAISGILADIVKIIVARVRPDMLFESNLYGFVWFKIGSEFNSFPSGHSATAFALCVGLIFLYPRYKYLYIFIAILVVMSRVILNFHYLSDTLVGALLGGVTALVIYRKYVVDLLNFNKNLPSNTLPIPSY